MGLPQCHTESPEASAAGTWGRGGTSTLPLLASHLPQERFGVLPPRGPWDLRCGAAILPRGTRGRPPGLDLPPRPARARRGPQHGAPNRTGGRARDAGETARVWPSGRGNDGRMGRSSREQSQMPSPRDVPPFPPPHPLLVPGLDPLPTFRVPSGPTPRGRAAPTAPERRLCADPRAAWPRPGRGRGERR